MFERAAKSEPMDKDFLDAHEDELRGALLDAQFELRALRRPVVLLLSGVAGSGRGRSMERLLHWLDTRGIEVHAATPDEPQDQDRPWAWRWWLRLPPDDRMAFFLDGWVGQAIEQRTADLLSDQEWSSMRSRIHAWEAHLVANGMHVIKIWLHLSQPQQQAELRRRRVESRELWHVEPTDLLAAARHGRTVAAVTELMQDPEASVPWHVVAAHCPNRRAWELATVLRDELRAAVAAVRVAENAPERPVPLAGNVLQQLDLGQSLGKKEYRQQMDFWSARLRMMQRWMRADGRAAIIVLEGMDAAGKGGAIRRLTGSFDPRYYDVHSIAAPTSVEKSRPWLWRFWTRVPRRGRIAIFDRSWYGRVLVERIEGFCSADDRDRAWHEIREFEQQCVSARVVVVKFWLQISASEQLRRFEERAEVEHKQHKLTDEDWRNREKAPHYEAAACDAFERTHQPDAPWILVAAEDKYHARVEVLRRTVECLARSLGVEVDSIPD